MIRWRPHSFEAATRTYTEMSDYRQLTPSHPTLAQESDSATVFSKKNSAPGFSSGILREGVFLEGV